MRIAVSGTPGTGKTTAVEHLDTDLTVVHLNDVIREEELTTGHDDDRDSAIADIDAVAEWLEGREDILFESHLAHLFPADRVAVLRCHPETIEKRLHSRETEPDSIAENAESEALDLVLAEAVQQHGEGAVYEIDTTDRGPPAVARELKAVIEGTREPGAGTVDFTDYL